MSLRAIIEWKRKADAYGVARYGLPAKEVDGTGEFKRMARGYVEGMSPHTYCDYYAERYGLDIIDNWTPSKAGLRYLQFGG